MLVSGQRLGFNPKDHDQTFFGLPDEVSDVSGVRPDADIGSINAPTSATFSPWRIYPKPPPPHWHWKDKNLVSHDPSEDEEFIYEECEVPGSDNWDFEIDERGVFQVYQDTKGELEILTPFLFFSGLIETTKTPNASLVSKSPPYVNISWT